MVLPGKDEQVVVHNGLFRGTGILVQLGKVLKKPFQVDLFSTTKSGLLKTDSAHESCIISSRSFEWESMSECDKHLNPKELGAYQMGVDDKWSATTIGETAAIRAQGRQWIHFGVFKPFFAIKKV